MLSGARFLQISCNRFSTEAGSLFLAQIYIILDNLCSPYSYLKTNNILRRAYRMLREALRRNRQRFHNGRTNHRIRRNVWQISYLQAYWLYWNKRALAYRFQKCDDYPA